MTEDEKSIKDVLWGIVKSAGLTLSFKQKRFKEVLRREPKDRQSADPNEGRRVRE